MSEWLLAALALLVMLAPLALAHWLLARQEARLKHNPPQPAAPNDQRPPAP